jgi:NAD+ synthase
MASFSPDVLAYDVSREADRICETLRSQVVRILKRKGAVVALSGGVDSSVVGALCARALGPERVQGLFMPERDSSSESLKLGRLLADRFRIPTQQEEITDILLALNCYRRRDEAIRSVVPSYAEGDKAKIVLPPVTDNPKYNIFSVVVQSPDGAQRKERLSLEAYLGIVAATNFKQRVRKAMEYYYADKLHYAVAGTPNRLEYDQGFFVKLGDGAADVKPIAHLYKTQVYRMAEFLGVPEEIRKRPPSTDTYPLEQGQDEFYFALPYHQMDLCLYAKDHGIPSGEAARAVGLTPEQVERVYLDIERKRSTTRYLHTGPLLVEKVLPDT